MSFSFEKVSAEIEIEGIPVTVSALYWPERGVTNPVAEVARENPDDKREFWEVLVRGDRVVLYEGSRLPGILYSENEGRILEAAEEAAERKFSE